MTRIEAGAVQVALAPVAVDEVIGAVLTRSRTLSQWADRPSFSASKRMSSATASRRACRSDR